MDSHIALDENIIFPQQYCVSQMNQFFFSLHFDAQLLHHTSNMNSNRIYSDEG